MNYLVVAASLEQARTRRDLIAAAQQIELVPEHWQRDRLGAIVRRRLDEFKKH